MQTLIIVNPRAGRHRKPRQCIDRLRDRGDVECRITERPRHAENLARAARVDRIIAVGGDGTVHETVNGLMQRDAEDRPELAVIPCGSGDDFAFACGVPRDVNAAAQRALQGQPKPVDVASIVDGGGRQRWFCNSAGLLLDGAVNMRSHRAPCAGFAKYALGAIAALMRDFQPNDLTITIDGQQVQTRAIMLTIANGPREGGAFYCLPDATNDDGRLDVMTIDAVSRLTLLRMLPAVLKGSHITHGAVHLAAGKQVRLAATAPMPIHLDGELWASPADGVREVTVEVHAAAIRVIA